MKRMLVIVSAGLLFGLLRCTGPLAGGGTETTNGISGAVAFADSMGRGTFAAIYAVDYQPDRRVGVAETTIVDVKGGFRFDALPESRYNLFVWDTANSQGAYVPDLPADTVVGTLALTATGTIVLQSALGATETKVELMIPGSPFYGDTASGAVPVLSFVPKGTYAIDLYTLSPLPSNGGSPVVKEEIVTVDPEIQDTVKIAVP